MPRKLSNDGLSLRFVLLHPAVWFLTATCCLIFLANTLWERHRDKFIHQKKFQFTRQQVDINETPAWFAHDLDLELEQLVSGNHSLLDPQVVPATKNFMENIPWVRKVNQIVKSSNGLKIELNYRRPIAMVYPGKQEPVFVDVDGVIFDKSLLEPVEIANFENQLMRIYMRQLQNPASIPWHAFPDARIPHATHLVDYIAQDAKELQLSYVVNEQLPAGSVSPRLELWTMNGTKVIWGVAPGFENQREASAHQKVSAIREFVSKFGSLMEFERKNDFKIDVSTGKPVLVKASRIAGSDDWINNIK